mgnify:CR=1 FL=1|jgi:hypothetical protein
MQTLAELTSNDSAIMRVFAEITLILLPITLISVSTPMELIFTSFVSVSSFLDLHYWYKVQTLNLNAAPIDLSVPSNT